MSWQTILAIGSGGFIGAISRAYLNGLINRNLPHDLPFGTLGVNIIGSLILGVLFALFYLYSIFFYPFKVIFINRNYGSINHLFYFCIRDFLASKSRKFSFRWSKYLFKCFLYCICSWKWF